MEKGKVWGGRQGIATWCGREAAAAQIDEMRLERPINVASPFFGHGFWFCGPPPQNSRLSEVSHAIILFGSPVFAL
jgi:hypothetical protein